MKDIAVELWDAIEGVLKCYYDGSSLPAVQLPLDAAIDKLDEIYHALRAKFHAPDPSKLPRKCKWVEEPDGEFYHTDCGHDWVFPDGTPKENGVKYCPLCGRPVSFERRRG